MHAAQEKPMTEVGPYEYKPRKSRIGAWIGATMFAGAFIGLSFSLGARTEGGGAVHPADQAAMIGLGLIGAGVILSFLRLRVRADEHGIEVRNVASTHRLPWGVVVGITVPERVQWATLELADDEEIAVMAIQMTDKRRAVEAVKHLRALMEQSRGS
ncbi:PH domain-containing protein [Glycomyces tenuis]|uniref:PH domain-containing protein n=1 Tax=Glycomyces tenuis TaxID=58116 RepID=UPI0003FB3FA1|nr:PH domain-containing protein [Glycomyces tenuis]